MFIEELTQSTLSAFALIGYPKAQIQKAAINCPNLHLKIGKAPLTNRNGVGSTAITSHARYHVGIVNCKKGSLP
jgi:hypothetical protein